MSKTERQEIAQHTALLEQSAPKEERSMSHSLVFLAWRALSDLNRIADALERLAAKHGVDGR